MLEIVMTLKQKKSFIRYMNYFRDDFKTQPPVDRRFHPVPGGFYYSKQWQQAGTGGRPAVGFWSRPIQIYIYNRTISTLQEKLNGLQENNFNCFKITFLPTKI